MPVEIVRNPMKVCRIIGENVFSTVVEEDINVPDINPDVYKILTPRAVVMLKDCEVLTDKVLVNGQVFINVLYAADLEGRPMSNIDISTSFSQSLDVPGAKPRMKDNINVVVQHVECSIINSRKVNMRVILDIKCKVEEIFDFELAADVRGLSDIQILREQSSFKQLVGHNRDQYEISEKLELPTEKPEINRILKTDFRIIEREDNAADGKVELNGVLGVNVLYASLDEENSINYVEYEIPYTRYIEIPEASRGMECLTSTAPSQIYIDVDENEMGERKKITVNAILTVNAKVFKAVEVDVVADAYSPTRLIELGKDIYKMDEMVGKAHSNTVVKESMSIKHGDPEIDKVYCVNAVPIVNDAKIMDDKIVVEGMLDCTAIYMTSYSAEPMCCLTEQIPFRHNLDIPGAKFGMVYNVKCNIDNISFSLMNSEMIETRVVISISADVCRPVEKRMVNRVEEAEGVPFDVNRIPAITIYIVQKGETLWSIAKRYSTTVDALVKLNNIENPSKIHAGMQIMIFKNVRISS